MENELKEFFGIDETYDVSKEAESCIKKLKAENSAYEKVLEFFSNHSNIDIILECIKIEKRQNEEVIKELLS